MSTDSDSSKPSETNQRKRSASPSEACEAAQPKHAKVSEEEPKHESCEDAELEKVGNGEPENKTELPKGESTTSAEGPGKADAQERARRTGTYAPTDAGDGEVGYQQPSDSAAIAAAEALASLTGGDEDGKEMPCSSKQVSREKSKDKSSRYSKGSERRMTEAAAADSSSSLLICEDREDPEQTAFMDEEEEEEDDDDSLPGSSSTASSSIVSDNEDNEDGECAIVSVKMAPEVRQSVALLAQVQMRLDALEKKSARLHQRLEMRISRQRRPHLDQRSAITQAIPGFWVTALLNHPHLSSHIDETDEDALSYMTNLEVESFKNSKLGYRIGFHFRRNPFFQNKVIVKELHLGMGGSLVSFSNPILWHRGQNLVGSGEPHRTSQGVYQSFFHWFSDHSNPGRDEIAQILKDDLYRNPLRYYLTPLWEPRENGSAPKPQGSNNGDDCVIISDSDEEQEQNNQNLNQGEEEDDDDDDQVAGSEENDRDEGESSYEERQEEEVDIEEVDESHDSGGCEVREQRQEEEDVDVDEGDDDES